MANSVHTYAEWSASDLTGRVLDLEKQLRELQASQDDIGRPSDFAPKKSRSDRAKKPREFDWTRYGSRLIALKFAYLGRNYNGFEHHANNFTPLPTVEQTIWGALMKAKLINPTGDTSGQRNALDWEGCDYSKCGRTDRGVSAFGQVIGIRVRSNRPVDGDNSSFDDDTDELCYIQMLNSLLPLDIRVLAWCPNPPTDFSARFHCRSRHYKYFFTQPSFTPTPGPSGFRPARVDSSETQNIQREGWLNICRMQDAAKRFEGLHDFRNFCKVDGSKQINDYRRRIQHSEIRRLRPDELPGAYITNSLFNQTSSSDEHSSDLQTQPYPQIYVFDLKGTAFLWHQVRHMVAVLFLVGQGLELPRVIDDLMNVEHCPEKPHYYMADDAPLVLWNCTFPGDSGDPLADTLDWRYVGEVAPVAGKRGGLSIKYGMRGSVDVAWTLWRDSKMDEILRGSLLNAIVAQPDYVHREAASSPRNPTTKKISKRIFMGGNGVGYTSNYVPLLKRERLKSVEEVNREYAEKNGLPGKRKDGEERVAAQPWADHSE